MQTRYATVMDRIVANSVEDRDTGCWVWTGKKTSGYAKMTMRRDGVVKSVRVIRVVLRETTDNEGEGMHAGHKTHCANPSCVNPHHLEWTTPTENYREKAERYGQTLRRLATYAP